MNISLTISRSLRHPLGNPVQEAEAAATGASAKPPLLHRLTFLLLLLIPAFAATAAGAIEIDESTSNFDILSKSYTLIDSTKNLTIKEVVAGEFTKNSQEVVNLGFAPEIALWIRFTLKNRSDRPVEKILEYSNPETEDIHFYDNDKVILDGMFHISDDRESINPIFEIHLAPEEERTFYLRAYAKIPTLIAKLTLWNEYDFIKSDWKHKTNLAIFFAIIVTLLLYNLMLYFFTEDRAYLYYIIYLFSVIIFESIYLGVAQLYLLSNSASILITRATIIYITILTIPIVLFTREFLGTKRFRKIDIVLKSYIYALPVIALLSYDNFLFDQNIMLLYIPLGLAMLYAGVHALNSGVQEARYYVIGWGVVITSLILSIIKSTGGYDITKIFPYTNELAFALEALLFSVALAHRIKILGEQKSIADERLIDFQQQEQVRLQTLVDKKTKNLNDLLLEKDILYKELNHRVKNNLAMILSLIKLQILKSDTEKTREELAVTKNRVNSISNLYETLHLQDSSANISTESYFQEIEQNIQMGFNKDVTVSYDIKHDLSIDSLIYCGLIINELLTNSFKYAFTDSGEIRIWVDKKDNTIFLGVEDNGAGFDGKDNSSLGLTIVQALVEKQLLGKLDIDSSNGTKVFIEWEEKGELSPSN